MRDDAFSRIAQNGLQYRVASVQDNVSDLIGREIIVSSVSVSYINLSF
jgi:hypothetical protein